VLQTLVNVVGDKKNGIYTIGPYLDLYKFEIIKKDIINFFNTLPNTEKTIPYSADAGQVKYMDVCGRWILKDVLGAWKLSEVEPFTQDQILDMTGMKEEIMNSVIANLKLLIRDSIIAYFLDRLYIQYLPDINVGLRWSINLQARGLKKYNDISPESLDCTVFSSCFITSYLTASSRNMIYKKSLKTNQRNPSTLYYGPNGARYTAMAGGGVLLDRPISSNTEVYAYERFSNLVRINNLYMMSPNLFFTANLGLPVNIWRKILRDSSITSGISWATTNDVTDDTFLGYTWEKNGSTREPCEPVVTKNINTRNPCRSCIRNIGTGSEWEYAGDNSACNKQMKKYSSAIVEMY